MYRLSGNTKTLHVAFILYISLNICGTLDIGLVVIFCVFCSSFLFRGNTPETRGTAYVVYEDIFDAKNACDHLSGFNVCNRYLVVLYYNANRVCMSITVSGGIVMSEDNHTIWFNSNKYICSHGNLKQILSF